MTYKTYLKKEIMEHSRKYRLLILFIVILISAFSAPVILYFLPKILESQTNASMDLTMLFDTGQVPAIQNFINDMYEIPGILIIVFAASTFVNEFTKETIVIPYSNGLNFKAMVLSKYTVYAVMITGLVGLGFIINHFYSGIVFNDFTARVQFTLQAFIAYSLFMLYHVSIVVLASVYTKRLFPVISITLASYFILPSLMELLQIKIGPYYLIKAFKLGPINDNIIYSMIGTIVIIGVFIIISLRKRIDI